jgi:protein gp37
MGLDVFGADTSKRRRTSKQLWRKPIRWNSEAEDKGVPERVFCASLADVFEDAPGPNEWRSELWDLVRSTPWLDWQLLTKRPENIARMLPDDWDQNEFGYWPSVWLGTSCEDNRVADRVPILTAVPAVVHFISYEPAIGPGDQISLEHIEWTIVGGESGPGYRPMDLRWAHDMWDRCKAAGVAFFFKQSAAFRTEMGIDALGEIVREYPAGYRRNPAIQRLQPADAGKE